MALLKTTRYVILSLRENMKPIKTKTSKTIKLFRIMDMDITEQQLKQAKAWYLSAKEIQQKHIGKS
jgi:hypothetical protein